MCRSTILILLTISQAITAAGCSQSPVSGTESYHTHSVDLEEMLELVSAVEDESLVPIEGAESPEEMANPFRPIPGFGDTKTTTIQLTGFADVNGARAIMLIDDRPVVMSEQQEFNGVRVVAITPPVLIVEHNGEQRHFSLHH